MGRAIRWTARCINATANSLAGMSATAPTQPHSQLGACDARAVTTAAATPSPEIKARAPR